MRVFSVPKRAYLSQKRSVYDNFLIELDVLLLILPVLSVRVRSPTINGTHTHKIEHQVAHKRKKSIIVVEYFNHARLDRLDFPPIGACALLC